MEEAQWVQNCYQLAELRRYAPPSIREELHGNVLRSVGGMTALCWWAWVRNCNEGNVQSLGLRIGGYSRSWTGFVVFWSGNIFCFWDVNLFTCGRIQPQVSLPCTSPSPFSPGQQTAPRCGVSHQACAELSFPFSFHACWANSDRRECVLALGVWDMYLVFHCLINCRGPKFWLCLLIHVHVTVYYCNPKDDYIRMWLLKLFLKSA